MHHPPSVLGDVIERNARYFPTKTAVVFEDRRVTFAAFAARARRFAKRASPCWRRTAWNISRRWVPRS
jgi:acyl-CoA synthetase (AMP-forming)/AMP-acid ligase II